jgi:hypothetical protein
MEPGKIRAGLARGLEGLKWGITAAQMLHSKIRPGWLGRTPWRSRLGSSNRSFDFLARKNFQITEPIGTSANRLVVKATAGAISHIQIDANRF